MKQLIQEFAAKYRLKVVRDDCNDPIIVGRIPESNIYEYSDSELGVIFMSSIKKALRTNLWKKFKAACLDAGMVLRQNGDAEGARQKRERPATEREILG